jgi:hypothetical protein
MEVDLSGTRRGGAAGLRVVLLKLGDERQSRSASSGASSMPRKRCCEEPTKKRPPND